MHPGVAVAAVWYTHPLHACAGVLGVTLLVWSLVPATAGNEPPRPHRRGLDLDFWERAGKVWRASRARASAAMVGILLIVWSLSVVVGMW